MANPMTSRERCLPEHITPAGDVVVARIVVSVLASGALSVEGPLSDPQWCLAALDHAAQSIKRQQTPRDQIIIPGSDTDL